MHRVGVVFATVAVLAGGASAQEVVAQDAALGPGFVTIQRFDATSRAGLDLMYIEIDGNDDATFLRFDAHGQYVDPASRVGGYIQMPLSYLNTDSDSDAAFGNLEVGGIWAPRFANPSTAIVLHGGIVLPTAEDGNLVALLGGTMRPHDFYQSIPDTTTIRLGVSPMFRQQSLFLRLDAGLDINVANADESDTIDPGVHLNIGAGVLVAPTTSVGAEVSTLTIVGDNDNESFSTAALSVRHTAGTAQLYGALVVPLDDEVRGTFSFGLTLGFEARL